MGEGRSVLGQRVGLALTAVVLVANVVGAAVVLVLAAWVLPTGPMADPEGARATNIALVVGYLAVAVPVGVLWGWLRFRRKPGDDATRFLVRAPGRAVRAAPARHRAGGAVGRRRGAVRVRQPAVRAAPRSPGRRDDPARRHRHLRPRLPAHRTDPPADHRRGAARHPVGAPRAAGDPLPVDRVLGARHGGADRRPDARGHGAAGQPRHQRSAARPDHGHARRHHVDLRVPRDGRGGARGGRSRAGRAEGDAPGRGGRSRRARRGLRRRRAGTAAGRVQPDGRRACASGSGCATSSGARWAATSPAWPSPPRRCGWGASCAAWRCCSSTSSDPPRSRPGARPPRWWRC